MDTPDTSNSFYDKLQAKGKELEHSELYILLKSKSDEFNIKIEIL